MVVSQDFSAAAASLREHARARPGAPKLTAGLGDTRATWVPLVTAREQQLAEWAQSTFDVVRRAEEVLVKAANAMGQVDRWAAEIEGHAAALGARAHRELMSLVRELGEDIDARCGQEILLLAELLCTDYTSHAVELGDLHGVRVGDIDAIQRAHAANAHLPREVDEILAREDVAVLEISDGRAAFAIGDIDSAPAIITLVGGVGSSDPAQWAGQIERARHLQRATGDAVVAWMGYDAPPTVAAGITPDAARRGGASLTRFQQALRSRGDARLVVVGHSYGSVVTGHATRSGERVADAVVVVGSPGLPEGAPAPDAVGIGTKDPIAAVAGLHGFDPTPVAEIVVRPKVNHSDYFTDPELLKVVREMTNGPTAK